MFCLKHADYEHLYVPLASAYYVARLADALGYQANCPTNRTFLEELDITTVWSGVHGAVAIGKITNRQTNARREKNIPRIRSVVLFDVHFTFIKYTVWYTYKK